MTNLNKEREEIIYELLLSLNNGNSCYTNERVSLAMEQYDELVKNGIVTEWCEHNWEFVEQYESPINTGDEYRFKCSKCGEVKITQSPF
jgi:hypothetical protein